MRAKVIQLPPHKPYRSMASEPYSEQVGRWRQRGPKTGEMPYR